MFSRERLSVDTFPTFTTFKLNNISTILFYTRYRKIPPIFSGRWNTLSNITWSTRNTMNIFNLFDFSHEILQSLFAFYESTGIDKSFSSVLSVCAYYAVTKCQNTSGVESAEKNRCFPLSHVGFVVVFRAFPLCCLADCLWNISRLSLFLYMHRLQT